jgi:hypothetical protein
MEIRRRSAGLATRRRPNASILRGLLDFRRTSHSPYSCSSDRALLASIALIGRRARDLMPNGRIGMSGIQQRLCDQPSDFTRVPPRKNKSDPDAETPAR